MNVQRQIAALSRPYFDETLILRAVPDSDVPFRATITDAPLRIGKIQNQQASGDRSSHEATVAARTAFKHTQESGVATAQFIDVKEIPVLGASCAVVQVHSGFFHSVPIQIAVGYGIDANEWSMLAFIFILTWRVEVVYASYGTNMRLWQGTNPARDRGN